ncbi:MerR family transcriptional regulator [uncultured Treponema sp.]|uniref:MerR family transcriptional regulator n=1 Tax=uncultured Treponema sp. TaxID=162155 RepID=UPI002591CF61|nr:MerR family transcriptional regulator [uncultured Treponema sp.]
MSEKEYSVSEAVRLIGVESHVLRYWEETVPGFAPRKDYSGRRIYSQRDVEIVLRLKYLIYVKKFTIEGAKNQIIEDAENVQNNPDAVMEIRKIRADLSELFFEIQKAKRQEEN